MVYTFKIFPEKRLIIESFAGDLEPESLLECFHTVWEHPDYRTDFCGLSDMRDAQFAMSLSEFRTLEERMYQHPKKCRGRWAWIADRPSPTAFGILHQQKSSETSPFSVFSVFSEWKNGFNWIQADYAPELVKEVRLLRGCESFHDIMLQV